MHTASGSLFFVGIVSPDLLAPARLAALLKASTPHVGLVVLLCSGQALPAAAQITPSQSLQQQLQDERKREAVDQLEDLNRKDRPSLDSWSPESDDLSDGFLLKGLRIEGVLPQNALGIQELLSGWIDTEINSQSLRAFRAAILNWYSSRDQLVAVQFPPQDLSEGVLTVRILESILGGVRVNSELKHHLRDQVALRYISAAVPLGTVIRPGKLESALLKLNDLAGVEVRARLEAGRLPGSTDVVLDVRDGDRHNLVLDVDNYLNRFSGAIRTSLEFNASNFDGRGSRAWVKPSWWGNAQGTGTAPIAAGLKLPIGSDGLQFSVSANYGKYRVLDELFESDINGQTLAGDFSFVYPLWRRPDRSVFVSLGGSLLSFDDYVGDLEIDEKDAGVVRASLVSISRDRFMGLGLNTLIAGVSVGTVDLSGNRIYQAFDSLTAQVEGGYVKGTFLYRREQQFDSRWGMRFLLNGQIADDNLDGFEQCGLGWPNGVRAYPPGEGSSTNCLVGQLDLSYQLKPGLKLIGFADAGWGQRWLSTFPGSLEPNSYSLFGAGMGFDLALSQQALVNVRVAFPLGQNSLYSNGLDADGYDAPVRVWAGLKVLM